ncbi:MAG TPA: ATP synthase subunit I [Blastocatellia bacterium]
MTLGDKGDRELPPSDGLTSSDAEELPFTEPAAVERRVWRNIFIVIFLAIIASAALADSRFMLGVALGGALALLNYKWLHSSLRGILAAGGAKAPPGTAMKFVTRWLVIAAVAWAAHRTGYFEAVGILAGLFAPAIAVMVEAAYVTFKTLAHHNGER